jgi:cyclohexyl-isocyanide hydratase
MHKAYNVVFPIYSDLTQLDMTGPAQVLSRMPGAVIHVAAATLEPVRTDAGFAILPTVTLQDCPQADMICVSGGAGTTTAMADDVLLAWLRKQAEAAELVTSVCTGSLILAAAGLLRGYRAACYWAWRDMLRPFGAEPVAARVVVDRNRITGGGVTAGIDFAFRVIEHLHGREEAEIVRLMLEYDPEPIGQGGTPETARPEILAVTKDRMLSRGSGERMRAMQALVER